MFITDEQQKCTAFSETNTAVTFV